MGDTRARSSRSAGAALPMTRRQQKRARQQQARSSAAAERTPITSRSKPANTPRAQASASALPHLSSRTETPRTRSAPSPAPAIPASAVTPARKAAAAANTTGRSASTPVARLTRPPRRRVTVSPRPATINAAGKLQDDSLLDAGPPAPESAETLPAQDNARTSPAQAEQPAQAKKYPTLAKIAAVRRPPAMDSVQVAEDTSDALHEGQISTPPAPASAQDDGQDTAPTRAAPVVAEPAHAARRQPLITQRLQATRDDAAIASMRRHARETGSDESSSTRSSFSRHARPLPEVDLALPVAGAHATVAAIAALASAALLIQGASGAIWPLILTAVAGIGGWLAYMLGQQRRYRRAAGAVLALSEVGVLVWLMLVFGPSGAFLALVPAIALIALRVSGLAAAVGGSALAVVGYVTLSVLASGQRVQPVARLTTSAQTLISAVAVSAGVLVSLLTLAIWQKQQARMELQSRARMREARAAQAQAAREQQRLDEGLRLVEDALADVLRGRAVGELPSGPDLEALTERVTLIAERLTMLQKDREDHLRTEGAMRGLIREVERAWLGLPWAWPAPSGTTLDELVALLRAPRSFESPASWPEETPTLVPIPSANSQPSRPWDVVAQRQYGHVSQPSQALYSQLPLDLDESDPRRAVPINAAQLPWQEWDMWRDWDPNQPRVVGE